MTWQISPAARMIRDAAELNDINPVAARHLWATAAPLELQAAETARAATERVERLLSAATCFIEAGRLFLCLTVIGLVLDHEMTGDQEQRALLLFEDVLNLASYEPSNLPN